ncbi:MULTISPECIES: hypothetical protein [unclassified Moorena]|nr:MULTISPECIES: hypothetical protein [unclassified Moorena]
MAHILIKAQAVSNQSQERAQGQNQKYCQKEQHRDMVKASSGCWA